MTPLDRTARLEEMLRRYREAEATGAAQANSAFAGQTGAGFEQMPGTWTDSYRKLRVILMSMSRGRPKQQRQLMARYVDATIGRRKLRRRQDGHWLYWSAEQRRWQPLHHAEVRVSVQLPDRSHATEWDCVVASWPSWVRRELVAAGLEFILAGGFEPFLPSEMLHDVAEKVAA